MARCIAFDKSTAQAISRNLHLLTVCDPEADPLQTALHSHAYLSLLALPSENGKHVLVAKFRRPALAPLNNDPSDSRPAASSASAMSRSMCPSAQPGNGGRSFWSKIPKISRLDQKLKAKPPRRVRGACTRYRVRPSLATTGTYP